MAKSFSDYAKKYLSDLKRALDQSPFEVLEEVMAAIEAAHASRRQIFIIGNGGSAATASHMMNDLTKGMLGYKGDAPWPPFRAIALTDNVPLMTAWANDTDYTQVFSGPLRSLAQPGDLLIAISASGNSPNIVSAVEAAKEIGLTVVGLTGFGGGKLAKMADVVFTVPSDQYGPVEVIHLLLDHLMIDYLYEKLKEAHAKETINLEESRI